MRQISYLLLVVAVAGLGCTPASFLHNDPPPKVEIKPPPAPPIVLPDSVNEKNASECARSLREEMEYDAARKPAPAAGPEQKN
jgi:hypothetical protein